MSRDIRVVSFGRTAAYVHHRAMVNRRDNHVVDALELLRHAVEEQPRNLEYRLDLAELYCEMGYHEQSMRLLLDILAEEGGPSECFYGLALNQLEMNDLFGARRSLEIYRQNEPSGAHSEGVDHLAAQLDYVDRMAYSPDRNVRRALKLADRACEAMQRGNMNKACRLLVDSMDLVPARQDLRAMYAMALIADGQPERAVRQVEQACRLGSHSVRTLCISAQVYERAGDRAMAEELIDRAARENPEGADLRYMIYVMSELDMDEHVSAFTCKALRDEPYDRELLHMRAVALYRTGASQAGAAKYWSRILRIDPQDSVAHFYYQTALAGELDHYQTEYIYRVPSAESKRRLDLLIAQLSRGVENIRDKWNEDSEFRRLMTWALEAGDSRLNHAVMTVLSTIQHRESRSLLRFLLFKRGISDELKMHTIVMLRLQGVDISSIMPENVGLSMGFAPDVVSQTNRLAVGERQLVRYADEILRLEYGVSALPQLLMLWSAYRLSRGTKCEPIRSVGAGAAALAYNYLLIREKKPRIVRLCKCFGCHTRKMVYYAARIAGSLEKARASIDRNLISGE